MLLVYDIFTPEKDIQTLYCINNCNIQKYRTLPIKIRKAQKCFAHENKDDINTKCVKALFKAV